MANGIAIDRVNTLIRCKPLLGTVVSIHLSGASPRAALLEASQLAFSAIDSVHRALNFHAPDSELSKLNSASGRWCDASAALIEVLSCALSISAQSDGVFDVCTNMISSTKSRTTPAPSWRDIELDIERKSVRLHRSAKIDLGGIAKGYAVDCAVDVLQRFFDTASDSVQAATLDQQPHFSVNAGGDLRLSDWRNQMTHVRVPNSEALIAVPMQNAAFASSSDEVRRRTIDTQRQRLAHRSGHCYSVFSARCMHADALTKVLRLHPAPHAVLAHFFATGLVTCASNVESESNVQHATLACA